jgi:hypothetical protein
MTCDDQPHYRAYFVWAWENSSSVTEVSVRMNRLGYFEFDPNLVLEYARALHDQGVELKAVCRSELPAYVEAPQVCTAEMPRPSIVLFEELAHDPPSETILVLDARSNSRRPYDYFVCYQHGGMEKSALIEAIQRRLARDE